MTALLKTKDRQITNQVNGSLPAQALYRFTVEQYRRMSDAGILTEDDRVELLEGWIIPKVTHHPPHDASISLTQAELAPRLPPDWTLRIQSAINTDDSEPEPDIAAVRGTARRYARAHPKPRDIGMLVEVAESSLAEDRERKGRIYARARIPVYWIINLVEGILEVYTQPRGRKKPRYTERHDYLPEDKVPFVLDGKEVARIPVRDLMVLPDEEA
jgi:Uma2 family endonuclease